MYLLVNKLVQAITESERLPPFLNKIVRADPQPAEMEELEM